MNQNSAGSVELPCQSIVKFRVHVFRGTTEHKQRLMQQFINGHRMGIHPRNTDAASLTINQVKEISSPLPRSVHFLSAEE